MVPLVVVGLNSELFRGFFEVQLVGLGDNLKGLDEVDDDVSPQDAACPKKTDIKSNGLSMRSSRRRIVAGLEWSRLGQCIRGAKVQITLKKRIFYFCSIITSKLGLLRSKRSTK